MSHRFISIILGPLRDLREFLRKATAQFGSAFLFIIGLTYFLQGFRSYAFGDGIIWFFSHVFQLDPGPTQLYMSTIFITWNIKMVYGLVFDNFPLFGRKDVPYMVLSGVIAFLGFAALGFPALTPTPAATTVWFFLALMGLAMSDVIVDAMVVRHAREAGAAGGVDLQAFCWVLSSLGGIVGRPLAGLVNGRDGQGSRILLGVVYSACSALSCAVSILHREQKCADPHWSAARFLAQMRRLLEAVFGNKFVYLPMTWIVLNQAVVPDVGAAMNFWKKDAIDIGADRKAYIDTVGDVFAISGIVLYTRYLKAVRFSWVFFWTQIAVAVFAMSDIVLVQRWNVAIGIPDYFFLIGSQTIINTLYSLQAMPFFVLAAQLCPADIEATFYAAMMSMGNIGGNISTLFGGYLLGALHIVRVAPAAVEGAAGGADTPEYDFTNLTLALAIRVAAMAASAGFVFVVVPNVPEPDGGAGGACKSAETVGGDDGSGGGDGHIKLVRRHGEYSRVAVLAPEEVDDSLGGSVGDGGGAEGEDGRRHLN